MAQVLDPHTGPTLHRRPREREQPHRALLLWAMQHPDRRSLRAVARALGRGASTVHNWQHTNDWTARAAVPGSENAAVAEYRRLYLADYGPVELPKVAGRMVVPLARDPDAPGTGASDAASRVRPAVGQELARRRSDKEAVRRQHLELIDAALGQYKRQLAAGEVAVQPRDLVVLLQHRALLVGPAEPAQMRPATELLLARAALGQAAILPLGDAARLVPGREADVRDFLRRTSVVRVFLGAEVVLWEDVLQALPPAKRSVPPVVPLRRRPLAPI